MHKAGLDKLRAQAEKTASLIDVPAEIFTLPARGQVLRWQTETSEPAPTLTLTVTGPAAPEHATEDAGHQAWKETRVVLIIWVLLLGLTWAPWAAKMRHFWPEQVAALAVGGWYLEGFSLLVLVLLLLAVVGRIWLVGSWLRVRRPTEAAASAVQAVGSA
jgi:hypothetical protein